ncbi:MAG: nicotinate-nucleotide--dimethylbenzimidazole phosphoribosyltransferase [Deltaproteobacteria bacterium]
MTGDAFPAGQREGVYRAIRERRDIRNYRPDPLPDEVLWRILGAAHRAPSVGLMQPWDFILLRDRALRQRTYEHFRCVNERAASVHPDERAATYRALKLQGILDAPLNVLVSCDRRRGGPHVLGRFTMRHMDEYSTCLAVQNLWLAARAEGVGVGWMSLLEPEFICELLALPEGVVPVAYLTLGYPVSFPDEPLLELTGWSARRPLAELVHAERYGTPAPPPAAAAARARTQATVAEIEPPRAAEQRQAELTKPRGSLGRLESLALDLAAMQGREHPSCRAPSLLLFAGDHGIAEEGVSAYLSRATAQMVYQYLSGAAAVNVLCRQHGVALHVADVGVDHDFGAATGLAHFKVRRGTRNFTREPAMTHAELEQALAAGAALVARVPDSEVIGLGEMGIGNTTASAALLAALSGESAAQVVGRGTGISDATLARKQDVVQRGLARHAPVNASDALRCFGGFEIAALVGALEAAAGSGRMVVLDGFITGVAALVALERQPALRRYLVAAHLSAEAGHAGVLERLGLRPLLDLELRLGEGTGAVLAISLLDSASRLMREMRTFAEANLERPLDPRDQHGRAAHARER